MLSTINEQELNKKLAERVGLCWHDWVWEALERFWDEDARYNTWKAKCRKCGVSVIAVTDYGKRTEQGFGHDKPNFTQSLDACFEWLVPEAVKMIINSNKRLTKWGALKRLFELWIEECVEEEQIILALCLAIEKLVDGEQNALR